MSYYLLPSPILSAHPHSSLPLSTVLFSSMAIRGSAVTLKHRLKLYLDALCTRQF